MRRKSKHDEETLRNGMVHFILSHSYVVFLLAVVLGIIFHIIFTVNIFSGSLYSYLGFGLIILGSSLIYWAQSTSSHTRKQVKEGTERAFHRGPYRYSRNPTHIGLTIMTLGLGLVVHSFFIFIFIIIASLITKFIFLKKEETLLEQKYGEIYSEYKKKVKTWV